MDPKKKPRNRQERFYCAYADMLGARRKVDQGKIKPRRMVERGKRG